MAIAVDKCGQRDPRQMDLPFSQSKKVVRFTDVGWPITVGRPAFIRPLDHPSNLVSNTKMVLTTNVEQVITVVDGEITEFETENTIYRRVVV
jgi:hypothetical protein